MPCVRSLKMKVVILGPGMVEFGSQRYVVCRGPPLAFWCTYVGKQEMQQAAEDSAPVIRYRGLRPCGVKSLLSCCLPSHSLDIM